MKLDKSTLVNNINRDLVDNATGEISPRDVRQNMLDVVDSVGNILATETIVSANFSTPEVNNTIAGDKALDKLDQDGYSTEGSTAIGYSSLKQNYIGNFNTGVGAFTLSCNVYGDHNVAVGYAALAGNTSGTGNVGIGDYSLYYNKLGSLNVAIGHGAGYYLDRNTSNKLFIAAHPVTEQYVCDNPEGVGLTPLVHGDFATRQFGINVDVNDLHSFGALQVSGAISPSQNLVFNLGDSNYAFNTAYIRGVEFADNAITRYDNDALAIITSGVSAHAGDVDPLSDVAYALGDNDKRWREIYSHDLYVTGTATINELNTITSCLYECKTLYLATSGVCEGELTPCGYLGEENLIGAGIIVPASGSYGSDPIVRDYKMTLAPSGEVNTDLLPYYNVGAAKTLKDQAAWLSNINIHVSGDDKDAHVMSKQFVGPGNALFINMMENGKSAGMSLPNDDYDPIVFSNGEYVAVGSKFAYDTQSSTVTAYQSRYCFVINDPVGTTDAQALNSRRLAIQSEDYRVPVSFNFQHSAGNKRGVEFKSQPSGAVPGMFISTYDGSNSSNDINTVSIMQDDSTGGVFGVHNFADEAEQRYPETIINARSTGDAALRVTAENAGNVTASVELCGEENCLANAAEFAYNKPSGVATIATYLDSGRVIHTTYDTAGGNTIFNNGNVQLGDNTDEGILSFRDHASNSVAATQTGFTRLFSRHVDNKLNQASELVYVDTSGNVIPLSLVTTYTDPLFVDGNNNVFGGSGTPSDRLLLTSASGNTALGNNALYALTEGAEPQGALNTALGFSAGSGIHDGSGNIAIGVENYNIVGNVNNNIVLGNNSSPTSDNNILIGNNIGSGLSPNTLLIGHDNDVLIKGSITDHNIYLPTSGTLSFLSNNDITSTVLKDGNVTIYGSGSRYGEDPFTITFAGSGGLTCDLITLDHSAYYDMNNEENYTTTNPRRAFMKVDGDVRVRGAVRFADGTSITSGSGVSNIQNELNSIQERINSQTVDGIMAIDVDSPSNRLLPTSGILTTLAGESVWISNRDIYLRLEEGDYVVANRIVVAGQDEYRPVWVSNEESACGCSRPADSSGAEETLF